MLRCENLHQVSSDALFDPTGKTSNFVDLFSTLICHTQQCSSDWLYPEELGSGFCVVLGLCPEWIAGYSQSDSVASNAAASSEKDGTCTKKMCRKKHSTVRHSTNQSLRKDFRSPYDAAVMAGWVGTLHDEHNTAVMIAPSFAGSSCESFCMGWLVAAPYALGVSKNWHTHW